MVLPIFAMEIEAAPTVVDAHQDNARAQAKEKQLRGKTYPKTKRDAHLKEASPNFWYARLKSRQYAKTA